MATRILTAAQPVKHTPQYHLPEPDRQAILAHSDQVSRTQKIEFQRQSFISNNFGCAFGQKLHEQSSKS